MSAAYGHLHTGYRLNFKTHISFLGIFISWSLKDSFHIKTHFTQKVNQLKIYISMTISSHLYINQVEFGFSLWFDDNKYLEDMISSMQYTRARSILKLCMPAECALFSDLGWLPIKYHMVNFRICYFLHLPCLQSDISSGRLVWLDFQEVTGSIYWAWHILY